MAAFDTENAEAGFASAAMRSVPVIRGIRLMPR
jgi:hypothetical protein